MKKAATHGDVDAMFILSFMTANGEGVPSDSVRSMHW